MKIVLNSKMNSKLLYKGPFGGSTGYHGNRIDILKSGIQKYVRRDETSKALSCAISLNMFRELEPKSKCIRTVLINRLRIISCEEFAWSNPKLFHYIDNSHKEIMSVNSNKMVKFTVSKNS